MSAAPKGTDWAVIAGLLQRAFPALAAVPVAELAVTLAVVAPFALSFGAAVAQAFAAAQAHTIAEGWRYEFDSLNPAAPPRLVCRQPLEAPDA